MAKEARPPRTAVLVVHGMGSQRPMETVRGVFEAVWFDEDVFGFSDKRYWRHPEQTIDDIDLTTFVTNLTPKYGRAFEFHELYWAHLMSETRAVAVLLWLFELLSKGPKLKKEMRLLWWASAIYIGLLLLAFSQLALTLLVHLTGDRASFSQGLVSEPLALILVLTLVGAILTALHRAFWSAFLLLMGSGTIAALIYFALILYANSSLVCLIQSGVFMEIVTPFLLTLLVGSFLMGWRGALVVFMAFMFTAAAFYIDELIDSIVFIVKWFGSQCLSCLTPPRAEPLEKAWQDAVEKIYAGHFPWAIKDVQSTIVAALLLASYMALDAFFLSPYLGDAARYFRAAPANVAGRREIRRQAVMMLERLHLSGDYDRIIVVAHSLGTVIAYDMLRAYFGRISCRIPILGLAYGQDFEMLDRCALSPEEQRKLGRRMIARIAEVVSAISGPAVSELEDSPRAWLVTDFVTLGSPLTHTYYLMCLGQTESELRSDFLGYVRQREFPTCPPAAFNGSNCLTFIDVNGERHFHNGAVFALTRWTNLYFKQWQLLWGDAIGGAVGHDTLGREMFGKHVEDVEIFETSERKPSFFAHKKYWSTISPERRQAPHLAALRAAVGLEDRVMNTDTMCGGVRMP